MEPPRNGASVSQPSSSSQIPTPSEVGVFSGLQEQFPDSDLEAKLADIQEGMITETNIVQIDDDGTITVTHAPSLVAPESVRNAAVEEPPISSAEVISSATSGGSKHKRMNGRGTMAIAAVTIVYNEKVNLPIWVNYYGSQFGLENLFVLDQSSDDGSTHDLGKVNVIRVPRSEFDEDAKTNLMASFHKGLTSCYDTVVITDCDEILAPDPDKYESLADYIKKYEGDCVNAVGVDILHLLTEEPPLDFSKPILSQRTAGRFHSPECKQLISKTPTEWLPGLHASNKKPFFDPDLVLFHLKVMDYGSAVKRHEVNRATVWSKKSLDHNYGEHHRYELAKFVHQYFLVPLDLIRREQIFDFDFQEEISQLDSRVKRDQNGFYRVPMDVSKLVRIPAKFRSIL